MKPLVSIVMPVYNVEKYLRETIDSIVNQTYKNYELICVDDGSTDASIDILQEYAERDKRISIIRQKNQYAGVARNNGMASANGKYIMFLDSDDVFERDMLTYLVRKAEKNSTDIIFFGFYHFSDDIHHRSLMGIPYFDNKVCSPNKHQEDLFRIAQGVPWNKFYNRDFVVSTGLKFQALQSNNDVFFSKMIVPEANRILFSNKRFVNYRISNSESLQGSYKLTSGNFAKCITAMYDELIIRGKYDYYKDTFIRYVIESFMLIFNKPFSEEIFDEVCRIMRSSLTYMKIDKAEISKYSGNSQLILSSILDNNYRKALVELDNYRKSNWVSKQSAEYRYGKKLLRLLRVKSYD